MHLPIAETRIAPAAALARRRRWLPTLTGSRLDRNVAGWTRTMAVLALGVCALSAGVASGRAEAASRWSAHLEGGFGSDVVRPMAIESTPAAMASAGASIGVVRSLRLGLELTATGGGELGSVHIPESPRPGRRTLRTLLAGLELAGGHGLGTPYGFAGLGFGRSTLADAFGGLAPMYPGAPLPQDLTTLATGAGLGYRFRGGPSRLGWQLGLRVHGLVDAGAFVAWAGGATVGLAY